eukprot:1159725-Pelagomonas_calceolata.AAC.7
MVPCVVHMEFQLIPDLQANRKGKDRRQQACLSRWPSIKLLMGLCTTLQKGKRGQGSIILTLFWVHDTSLTHALMRTYTRWSTVS